MGCRVGRNKNGRLALRLWWRGRRSWEGTGLRDTPENRADLERLAKVISTEIRSGAFTADRYRFYFPGGTRLAALEAPESPRALTLRLYVEEWIERNKPPVRRDSYTKDAAQHCKRYIFPATFEGHAVGEIPIDKIDKRTVEAVRTYILSLDVKLKTAKNAIAGTLKAILRDAIADGLIASNPCALVAWDRQPRQNIDPFDAAERDAICEHFARGPYGAFVAFLLWSGARESEVTALRWGDVDMVRGRVSIRRSRVRGKEAATKTMRSDRTIELVPEALAPLARIYPVGAVGPDLHVFRGPRGSAIRQQNFNERNWMSALRKLEIRPRGLNQCRHTFASLALTYGTNAKFLAEYMGTSLAMLERHYGRWIGSAGEPQLPRLRGESGDRHQSRPETAANSRVSEGFRTQAALKGKRP